MDLLVELVVGLAWPLVVLIIVLLFRRELARAFAKLTRIRYKELEAEFGQTLKELESQASSQLPIDVTTVIKKPLDDRRKEISSIASASPRAAILEAWLELERSVLEAGRRADMPVEKGANWIMRRLVEKGIINSYFEAVFSSLRNLRNMAAHEPDFRLPENRVSEYVDFSLEIAGAINQLSDR